MNENKKLDSERLLYKLILQFSIYTRGTNSFLEPHLLNISNKIKLGINYHRLTPELTDLSKALANIPSLSGQIDDTPQAEAEIQQQYFISRLNKLLQVTNIPVKFQNQCALLLQRSKSNLDAITYKKFVDSAISLLLNIKDTADTEKQYIELFLADIPKQLSSLEQQTLYASKSNTESIKNRESLRDEIDQQVENIKKSSAQTTELSVLQENINNQLHELNSQLHKHKETEDFRQLETQEQLGLMSQKLQDMEGEAETLRNNLKVAHDKAFNDSLTGLPNRLACDERIKLEYNRWKRYKTPLTLIIWDIDRFKLINDTFGHKAGDKTLGLVAQLILNNCRDTDFIGRFGGEEFVMLLPNTSSADALKPAEKIRAIISKSGFNHNGESIKITISCGISQFSEEGENEQEAVFERADKALYLSKEKGRNMCSILNKEDM